MKDWNCLGDAFAPAPEHFTLRMQATLEHMEELTVKRRHRATLAALVAVLVLALGAALAAAGFGVLEFMAYSTKDGTKIVNETLVEHVQNVGMGQEGSSSRIQVLDAICDGNTLSLAWSLENLSGQKLYAVWDAEVDGGERSFNGGNATGYELFLDAGKAMDGGLSYNLEPGVTGDEVEVRLSFQVMAPKADIVKGEPLADTMTWEEQQAALDRMDAAVGSGKIVVVGGEIELPPDSVREGESKGDALQRLGLMETVDSLEVAFTLKVTGNTTNLLPEGTPLENQLEGYRMVLSSADLSPTRLRFTVDYIFDGQAQWERFQKAWEHTSLWPVAEDGGDWYANGGGTVEDPVEREDGTVLVRHEYSITQLLRMPESITIAAVSDQGRGKEATSVFHPGEAFTLTLAE